MLPQPCINALKSLAPEYFSLSADDQQKWRVSLGDKKLYQKIQLHLLTEDYGMKEKTAKKKMTAMGKKRFSPEEQSWINLHMLYLTGIGESYFYLNEHLGEGKTTLDFATLGDYDYQDYLFQELASKEFSNHTPKPYRGTLSACWARSIENGRLVYHNLSMLDSYIYFFLEEIERELLDEHIPHRYVDGPDNGKKVNGGFLWDMKLEAYGKETLLEEMRTQIRTYIGERTKALSIEWDAAPKGLVWIVPEEDQFMDTKDDDNYTFVFSDKSALDVRFTHFLRDCRARTGDLTVLETIKEKEKTLMVAWFNETLKKTQQNLLEK